MPNNGKRAVNECSGVGYGAMAIFEETSANKDSALNLCLGLFKNVQMQGAQGRRSEAYFRCTPQRRGLKRNTADEQFSIDPVT
jgi:hypothetical protein